MKPDYTNFEINNFTENKESSITISEELFHCILDITGDAMLLTDKETGQIIYANQAAEKLYEYNKMEFLHLKNSDLSADNEKTFYALKTRLSQVPVIYHKKKNGSVFPVEISAAYFEQSGKILRIINIRDITCRLEAEFKILEKKKEMDQLIYITAHDFRSSLLNIKGYSSELKEMFAGIKDNLTAIQDNEKLTGFNKYFDDNVGDSFYYIDLSCTKLNSMIDGLLKISRLSKIELFYQRINMNNFCHSVSALHSNLLKEKNIIVEIDSLPDCLADLNLLNQVFANLFADAVKFIKIESEGLIKITGNVDSNHVTYCIEESSIGLESGKEKKISEIIKKINSDMLGEGLGLTIARKIIEYHNGKIWIESEEDNACKFFVQLPNLNNLNTESLGL